MLADTSYADDCMLGLLVYDCASAVRLCKVICFDNIPPSVSLSISRKESQLLFSRSTAKADNKSRGRYSTSRIPRSLLKLPTKMTLYMLPCNTSMLDAFVSTTTARQKSSSIARLQPAACYLSKLNAFALVFNPKPSQKRFENHVPLALQFLCGALTVGSPNWTPPLDPQ